MAKMTVPFGTIEITPSARAGVLAVLDSGRVSCGEQVDAFERAFAQRIGTAHAVAVASGTDALTLALAALYEFGARRGDEVVVPALSFVATGNAVVNAGFTPVFVDIERTTLNLDPSRLEAAVTPRTRAIVPVHLMGKPAAMGAVLEFADRHGLWVIEDAAEAYGTRLDGRAAGTFGAMATYSTYLAHMITSVEGGVVVTARDDLARVLRSLRAHGRACTCSPCVLNTSSGHCRRRFADGANRDSRFAFERIGFSSKMNELEAAVGLGSLARYDDILAARRANLARLQELFRPFSPLLHIIEAGPGEELGPQAFPFVRGEQAPFTRDELACYLEEQGVETRTLFLSMPTQCAGFAFLGYRPGQFPEAEYIGDNGLHIGVHQHLHAAQLEYVAEVTAAFLRRYR